MRSSAFAVGLILAATSAFAADDNPVPWPWVNSHKAHIADNLSEDVAQQQEFIVALTITRAELSIQKSNPPQMTISGAAIFSSPAFENINAVPMFYPASASAWPADKYYDFIVYAHPTGVATTPVLTPFEVSSTYALGVTDAINGIRLWGQENCVLVKSPGARPPESTKGCVEVPMK